jgi:hypothetical protein
LVEQRRQEQQQKPGMGACCCQQRLRSGSCLGCGSCLWRLCTAERSCCSMLTHQHWLHQLLLLLLV